MAIKIGDRVKIRKDSKYYGRDYSNPMDVIGEVCYINPDSSYSITVDWSNEHSNVYRESDLELTEQILDKDPIQIRDRIKEIVGIVEALSVEKEELVEALASMGFALIDVENPKEEGGNISIPSADLEDWRNWQEGDLIECVNNFGNFEGRLTVGKKYEVSDLTPGYVYLDEDDEGVHTGWDRNRFKFHSRPSK